MDSVRFGRVLGIGTRLAARTLVQAVDAATSPSPSAPASRSGIAQASSSPASNQSPAQSAGQPRPAPTIEDRRRPNSARLNAIQTGAGLAQGSRSFGRAIAEPVTRLSGVLWLELTGVFFGLFALTATIAAWHLRFALPASSPGHNRLLLTLAITALFTYFCVSSFVRARRRERRRP